MSRGVKILNRQRVALSNPLLSTREYWKDRGQRAKRSGMYADVYEAWNDQPDLRNFKTDADYMRAQSDFRSGFDPYGPFRTRNAPRLTQKDVDRAASSYHNMMMAYGENNMATQRAEWAYRDVQRKYAEQKAKRTGNPSSSLQRTLRRLSIPQLEEVMRYSDRMLFAALNEGFDSVRAREAADTAAERKAKELLKRG